MNQPEKQLIQALIDFEGLTVKEIAQRTGMTKRRAEVILSYIHCVYIDRWLDDEAVWCVADTPPHCPKP